MNRGNPTIEQVAERLTPLVKRFVAVRGKLPEGPQCLIVTADGEVKLFPQFAQIVAMSERPGDTFQRIAREHGIRAVGIVCQAFPVAGLPEHLLKVVEEVGDVSMQHYQGDKAAELYEWTRQQQAHLVLQIITPGGSRSYLMRYRCDELGSTLSEPEEDGGTEPLAALPDELRFWKPEALRS